MELEYPGKPPTNTKQLATSPHASQVKLFQWNSLGVTIGTKFLLAFIDLFSQIFVWYFKKILLRIKNISFNGREIHQQVALQNDGVRE